MSSHCCQAPRSSSVELSLEGRAFHPVCHGPNQEWKSCLPRFAESLLVCVSLGSWLCHSRQAHSKLSGRLYLPSWALHGQITVTGRPGLSHKAWVAGSCLNVLFWNMLWTMALDFELSGNLSLALNVVNIIVGIIVNHCVRSSSTLLGVRESQLN